MYNTKQWHKPAKTPTIVDLRRTAVTLSTRPTALVSWSTAPSTQTARGSCIRRSTPSATVFSTSTPSSSRSLNARHRWPSISGFCRTGRPGTITRRKHWWRRWRAASTNWRSTRAGRTRSTGLAKEISAGTCTFRSETEFNRRRIGQVGTPCTT